MRLRERLWPGLTPRGVWLEWHIAVSCAAVVAFEVAALNPGPLYSLLLVLVAVLLGVLLLLLRRRAPMVPFAVLLGVLLLLLRRRAPMVPFAVGAALSTIGLATGAMVSAYAVARYTASWRTRALAGGIGSLAAMRPWIHDTLDEWLAGIATAALVVVLPGALGVWQRTRAELLAALRERAERAEGERELLARDAVLTERTRIAREMHDAVGHRVSLMVLQAGAIEMAARDHQRVEQLAGQVQDAGRQALDELRQMVGVLRGEEIDEHAPLGPQPGLDELPALVQHAKEAGMDVDLHGSLPAVDPVVGRAAYRIVQEALTNAGRHAPGAPVHVSVEQPPAQLVVRVVNGPADGVPAGTPGGGYALVGLAERARTLGGRLTAEARLDGGFRVEAVLPA